MGSYEINLLPKEKNNLTDKFLHFLLYYFRYIIVITQIVVIGVFFFRLKEDQKVIELKQAYVQNQQILAAMAPIVDESTELQSKIGVIEDKLEVQNKSVDLLNLVITNVPSDVTIDSLTLSDTVILFSGKSESSLSIRSLRKKLSLEKDFESVVINSLERDFARNYTFGITITIKNGK